MNKTQGSNKMVIDKKNVDAKDAKSTNSKKADDNVSGNSKGKVPENNNNVMENDNNEKTTNKSNLPKPSQGSTRQYLEQTVVNAVMQGMALLAKERPSNPMEFLGNYLIQKSKEKDQ